MGSNNPFDMLQNKSSTWQDIAGALYGGYKSRSKKDRRAKWLATLGLIFLDAKEKKMLSNTSKNLRELERNKTLEYSKLVTQHNEQQGIVDQFETYRKNPLNYFENQAEVEIDTGDPDYWTRVGGVLGRDSLEAQRKRKEDVDKLATSKKNALFSKMGYRTNEEGVYDIDKNTQLPRIYVQDDPKTKDINEREVRKREILRRREVDEIQEPYNQYYAARQEELIQPKNISWAGKVLDRVSSVFRGYQVDDQGNYIKDPTTGKRIRKEKAEPTAIEKDAIRLLEEYKKSYNEASVSLSDDLVPLTVNGKSIYDIVKADGEAAIPKPFGYTKTLKADVSFTLQEAEERIWAQPNADLPTTEKRAIIESLQAIYNKELVEWKEAKTGNTEENFIFKISQPVFQAEILSKKKNYNAYTAQLSDRLRAFNDGYVASIEPRTLANFDINLKTIDPKTNAVYENAELWLNDAIKMSVEERQESIKTWNKTQRRAWERYKYEYTDAGTTFQGLGQDPIKTRLKNVNLLINRYMSNVEATQAGRDALYSPAEINTLKNSIIDLTESDITTSIMAKVELELSSFNELAARALKYNNGDTVPIYSVEKGKIVPTESEADYTRIRYANASIHANSLNEVIFGNIIP
jgi:hypothetical protein